MNYDLLRRLCLANGISGDEKNVREIIIEEIKDYAEYSVDNLGNIIVFKKGRKRAEKKLMISAHMDEVGFIVTEICDDGMIKFEEVGGIDRRVLPAVDVVINNSVNGVAGVKPIHLCEGDEDKTIPKLHDMYIDIGADSKEEAEKLVSLGDSVTFAPIYDDNGYTIKSKALDDRFGCFVMINMIKSELEYDTHFCFIVQEEVGLIGAKPAAFSVAPEFSIVLEATTAADVPDITAQKQVCNVGEGAVIGFMDRRTIYDREMLNLAFSVAERNNLKAQLKRAIAGGNDAGAVHLSREGVRTMAISIPCRYLHSQISLVSKSDVEEISKLVPLFAEEISGGSL